jgi:hypothetical protein
MVKDLGSPEENHDTTSGNKRPTKDTQYKDTQLKPVEPIGSGIKFYEKKKKPEGIGSVLERFKVPEKKAHGASYPWQDTAVRMWKKLNLNGKPTAGWFRLFKLNSDMAERSCAWASDSGGTDLEKLTFWAFNQFKKYGKINFQS